MGAANFGVKVPKISTTVCSDQRLSDKSFTRLFFGSFLAQKKEIETFWKSSDFSDQKELFVKGV